MARCTPWGHAQREMPRQSISRTKVVVSFAPHWTSGQFAAAHLASTLEVSTWAAVFPATHLLPESSKLTNHAGRRVSDLNASVVDEDDGAVCARESHYEQRAAQRKGSAEQRAGDEQ